MKLHNLLHLIIDVGPKHIEIYDVKNNRVREITEILSYYTKEELNDFANYRDHKIYNEKNEEIFRLEY